MWLICDHSLYSSARSSLPTYAKSNKENSEVAANGELHAVVGWSAYIVSTSSMVVGCTRTELNCHWFVWRTDAYSECPDKCCSLFLLQFKDCLGHALINSQHEVRLPEVSNYSNWRGMNLSSHGIVLNRRLWYFNWGWTKVRISHPLLCPSSPVFSFMHFVDWFGRLFYCWCHPSV